MVGSQNTATLAQSTRNPVIVSPVCPDDIPECKGLIILSILPVNFHGAALIQFSQE
jgi:hypothetical protein